MTPDQAVHLPQPILDERPNWVQLYHQSWASSPPTSAGAANQLIQAEFDALPAGLWEETAAFQALHDAGVARLERWEAAGADAPSSTEISPPQLTALLIAHVIGIKPDPTQNRILWRLSHLPPLGVTHLAWGEHRVHLRALAGSGGGQIIQVETQESLALELYTPHTTFIEWLRPGINQVLLTVLDRTDVRPG